MVRPRTYNPHKILPPLVIAKSKPMSFTGELKPWEDGKLLHNLIQASAILTEKLGDGYSVSKLRNRIKNGLLGEAGAIWFNDGRYKINMPRFLEWRSQYPDESHLRKRGRV